MDPAEHVRLELHASAASQPFPAAWAAALDRLPVPRTGREGEDWEAKLAPKVGPAV